jgi:hypothetical protein
VVARTGDSAASCCKKRPHIHTNIHSSDMHTHIQNSYWELTLGLWVQSFLIPSFPNIFQNYRLLISND